MKGLVFTLVAVQLLMAADLQEVKVESGPHVLYRCLVGKVDRQAFAEMALELLRPEDVTVGVLAVYGSKWERVVAGPDRSSASSYDNVRGYVDHYDIERFGCPEVQQAVKFGSGILVRTMDRGCHNETRMLQGKTSPLEMTVEGNHVELLEFGFWHPMGEGNEQNVYVSFFARTSGAITAEHAKAVIAQISAVTGIRRLSVGLRSDTWFYNFGDFPALFPWEGRPKLPSGEQFQRTREAYCSMFGPGLSRPDQPPILCHEYRGAGLKDNVDPNNR